MLEMILTNTNSTILVSHLIYPFNTTKRIIVLLPENAELESGYSHWIQLVKQLAGQLTSSIHFYLSENASENLCNSLQKEFKGHKLKTEKVNKAESIDDIPLLNDEDLAIVINARKQSISYTPAFYQLT